jgi:hypothetical protein
MIDIEKTIAREPDRRKRYQMRRDAAGLIRINFYVPADHAERFRQEARKLCDERLRECGWEPRR